MIDKQQIEHIAKLARIELSEQEKEKFTKELSSILDYVEKLKEADTSKVKGISQVTGLESVMREDEYKTADNRFTPTSRRGRQTAEKLLKQAPSKKDRYFKVPRVLE